jgi:NAD(P)-dependent dehydrogenase (short-subunit alcohol dehydrogenase family)
MNSKWTNESIPDLTGKIVIVTGANSGIGFEAAREFARSGAHVILASRNLDKIKDALKEIQVEHPQAKAEIIRLDLASINSIQDFVKTFKSNYDKLDILLNNAGIMMVPHGTTEDGFEKQFGINHLGHFALTGLMIDYLLKTPGSRVVNVSSNAHYTGEVNFSDLMYENGEKYNPQKAYSRSKLANLLFTYELQRRLDARNAEVIAIAAHPGISNTSLADHFFQRWFLKPIRPLMGVFFQSAAMGALPSIRAAVDSSVIGGQYFGPDGSGERSGFPVVVKSNPASHNLDDARKLWEISEELTGIQYLS